MVSLTIDGRKCEAPDGQSILDAASANGIYIPTLCAHPALEPEGSCRVCLIKVEGRPGVAPACATAVAEGIKVTTTDEELDRLRHNILELILSEHPSACIVCPDREACFKFNREPSKAGRTTGCRFCSNRDECELYDIVERYKFDTIDLPINYKDVPIYREDLFIQRDYNLCINCGRCIRACDDVRGNGAIAFTKRSADTIIGTAFDMPLQEVGCMFCGACVDVCPTGSLSEKSTKWSGEAEGTTATTCGICSVGCSLLVDHRWDAVLNVRPDPDGAVNSGQACVMGRFSVPTLVGGADRLRYPRVREGDELKPVSWDEALSAVKDRLAGYEPGRVGLLASPFLTNESLFAMQRFARETLGTGNIDTLSPMVKPVVGAMVARGARFITMDRLGDMEEIYILGADPSVTHPYLAVPLNAAKRNGARLIHVAEAGPKHACLAQEHRETDSLAEWCERLGGESAGKKAAVLFGEELLDEDPEEALGMLVRSGVGLLPLLSGPNAMGAADVGAIPGCGPGYTQAERGLGYPRMMRGIKALITTEAVPDDLEEMEFVVLLDIYPSPTMEEADVVLPTAAFTETGGTMTNMEHRVQPLRPAVEPPGMALPEWEVFSRLGGFGYDDVSQVTSDVMKSLGMDAPGIYGPAKADIRLRRGRPGPLFPPRYRGELLARRVRELGDLFRSWGVKE